MFFLLTGSAALFQRANVWAKSDLLQTSIFTPQVKTSKESIAHF